MGIASVIVIRLYSFTSSQSHCLTIFLQLRNQLITLLHHVVILLVFVVRSVGFDDTLPSDTVDGTRDSFGGNELGQITVQN